MTEIERKKKMLDLAMKISGIAVQCDDATYGKIKPYLSEIEKDFIELFDIIEELSKEKKDGEKA